MILALDSKIENLNRVGPAYLKRLKKLKINTAMDLLFHFPRRYEDFSQIVPIAQLKEGQKATIRAKIVKIKNRPSFRGHIGLTEALIEDDTGAIKAIWFNQPYLTQTLKNGVFLYLSGKLTFLKDTLGFSNPAYEIDYPRKETVHTGRLVPIYPETEGLTSRYLRYLIKPLLPLTGKITEFLPWQIKKQFGLMDLTTALRQIHFPQSLILAKKARQRLAFDELFLIQLNLLRQKQKLSRQKAIAVPFDEKLIRPFVKKLPFRLTDDQRLAAWQIFQDLEKSQPMNRLLNGDVGSGKTIVAIMADLAVAKSGFQTAVMAPTEVLTKQHFETFSYFLKNSRLNIALLTSSGQKAAGPLFKIKNKKLTRLEIKKKIAQGKIDIVIGTHALIQKGLIFKKLILVVVDEQHRFGVQQRAALQKSVYHLYDGLATIPHLLSMTATPIPRTLALTIYGDLDISFLKQMPKGRQKIITKITAPADRSKAYEFTRQQLKQKKQAYVICPLIEESEKLEVKSVTQEYEKLSQKIFPEFKIAMLHGKLKTKEKDEIMEKFKAGQTDILVSTSVVEVGIDVPNATVMLIEGAERFGLAQLHQFRGRIGRSQDQSYCFLLTESPAQKTQQRLKAVLASENGFKLAEKDLEIRGPGDFIGSRQWGLPDLAMASLTDLELIQKARQAALKTIATPQFLTPILSEKLLQFEGKIHFE